MERAPSWHTVDVSSTANNPNKQQQSMLFAMSDPSVTLSSQDPLSTTRPGGWTPRDAHPAGLSAPYAWNDDSAPFSFAPAQDDYLFNSRALNQPSHQPFASRPAPPMPDAYGMGLLLHHGLLAGHGPMGNPMAVSASSCRSSRAREIAIGRWTSEEHRWFLKGLEMFQGPAWGEIARLIGSRTSTQVRTHAQKFFTKLARQNQTLPHFEAQIRKERDRLVAQGIAVAGSGSRSSASRPPPSLLSRTSFSSDVGDAIHAYSYTQSVTPTATNAAFSLPNGAGGSGNVFALASLSPTAAKLSTLTKKRSHRDMLAMAMTDSESPSSSSSSLDAAAFSGLSDYTQQQQQPYGYLSAMPGCNKPRLNVDTSVNSTGYPQQPSPLSWCGPLPSPIQHPQHQQLQQSDINGVDESLPSMTNLLRRRSVTAVSPTSVCIN